MSNTELPIAVELDLDDRNRVTIVNQLRRRAPDDFDAVRATFNDEAGCFELYPVTEE